MRLIVRAAIAAALCLSVPAFAQQPVVSYGGRGPYTYTGTLLSTNDAVTSDLIGSMWATARWSVTTAGTATVTTEVSIDGGTNWLPSAYSRNVSAVSANPSTVPWSNNTPVVGTYETPLPGNATNFRVRCGTTGTATVVTVGPGAALTPGVPVVATLYDVTEGSIGAGIASTTQDTSGWNSVTVYATSPTGQVVAVAPVDDAGTNLAGVSRSFTAASSGIAVFTRYGGDSTSASIAASVIALYPSLTRRMSWSLPAGGTVSTGRIRIEASR